MGTLKGVKGLGFRDRGDVGVIYGLCRGCIGVIGLRVSSKNQPKTSTLYFVNFLTCNPMSVPDMCNVPYGVLENEKPQLVKQSFNKTIPRAKFHVSMIHTSLTCVPQV